MSIAKFYKNIVFSRHTYSVRDQIFFHVTSYIFSFMRSQSFVDVLQQAGAQAKLLLYEGKTHTDIFVQVSYCELNCDLIFSMFLTFQALLVGVFDNMYMYSHSINAVTY